MYTEAEAERKWCPHARVGFNGAAGNRYRMDIDRVSSSPFAVCIGSACMAWRSLGPNAEFQWAKEKPGPDWVLDEPCPVMPDGRRWKRKLPSTGYCGLSGKP